MYLWYSVLLRVVSDTFNRKPEASALAGVAHASGFRLSEQVCRS